MALGRLDPTTWNGCLHHSVLHHEPPPVNECMLAYTCSVVNRSAGFVPPHAQARVEIHSGVARSYLDRSAAACLALGDGTRLSKVD
mmetsp:Transcript_23784/g.59037  ORF Transcript_23784/g.59037 Transcript_23784/m.59037 type:complete len:86 (+) Transcript_23784:439-696(+)